MKSLIPSFREKNVGDSFHSLHEEIDRVFNDFSKGVPAAFGKAGDRFPAIDVSETDKAVDITAELPGVDDGDVDVTLSDRALVIKGEKKTESDRTEKDWHVVERSYGAFKRMIPIPFDADPDAVEAHFENGVLTVHLPKPPEEAEKASRIAIKSKA